MTPLSRRHLMAGAAAATTLAGCGPDLFTHKPKTIEEAVAGDWRLEADKARDKYRHPVETLNFWGLKRAMTVVEFWPGAGWYTDILAPFLAATGGKLYAANVEPLDDVRRKAVEAYRKKLASRRRLYGAVSVTAFGPTSGPVAPPGSADLALFLRNIHNWMAAGIADKAFADAFAALSGDKAVGCIVLTGAGPAFCAGMDTAQFGGDLDHRRLQRDITLVRCHRHDVHDERGEKPCPLHQRHLGHARRCDHHHVGRLARGREELA